MPYDPARHHRRSVRLPGYDYAGPGLYFVTSCTQGRAYPFGEVKGERIQSTALGRIADEEWRRTSEVRPNVALDVFVIMPNHVPLLFGISSENPVGATRRVAPTSGPASRSIGSIVGQYKSLVTKRINLLRGTPGVPVWQRSYHERIVRDDREADHIRRYIAGNPLRWRLDRYHAARPS